MLPTGSIYSYCLIERPGEWVSVCISGGDDKVEHGLHFVAIVLDVDQQPRVEDLVSLIVGYAGKE